MNFVMSILKKEIAAAGYDYDNGYNPSVFDAAKFLPDGNILCLMHDDDDSMVCIWVTSKNTNNEVGGWTGMPEFSSESHDEAVKFYENYGRWSSTIDSKIKCIFQTTDGLSFEFETDALAHQGMIDRYEAFGKSKQYIKLFENDINLKTNTIWAIHTFHRPDNIIKYVSGTLEACIKHALMHREFTDGVNFGEIEPINITAVK